MYLLTTRHLTETTASAAILAHRVLRKAVIPAAGLGRRMSSLTGGAPKEMLPLAGRPIIHHVVQEAIDAGIVEICIVIHKRKQEIRRYFESDNETGVYTDEWVAEHFPPTRGQLCL